MAQLGSALRSGRKGRRFKSGCPDIDMVGIRIGEERASKPRAANPRSGFDPQAYRLIKGGFMFNLVQEMESFAGQLRDADTFTGMAAHWLQMDVDYVSASHERLAATAEHAAALGIKAGGEALYRSGQLQVESQQVIADVYAAVVMSRLPEDAQFALDARSAPLGLILNELGARRRTHGIKLIDAIGQFGRQVMRVDAAILLAERPVAVVSEVVYRRLFVLGAGGSGPPLAA